MADHRRGARQHAPEGTDPERRDEGGHEALQRVQQHDRNSEPGSERPPDVRRPDIAAADGADVDAAPEPHEPVAEGQRAGEVAGDHEQGFDHGVIWYRPAQSLITAQSRFAKKASM